MPSVALTIYHLGSKSILRKVIPTMWVTVGIDWKISRTLGIMCTISPVFDMEGDF